MSPLHIFLLVSFATVCFLLIASVLLQTGKGGGMAGLGGGSSDSAFGAHTANVLQKFTMYCVIAFFVLVISLSHMSRRSGDNNSVMDDFVAPAETSKTEVSAEPIAPANIPAAIPVTLPSTPVAPATPKTTATATPKTTSPVAPSEPVK